MSIIDSSTLLASGTDGYQISRSLRFNSADSAYLNRTPASAGNGTTWTWSGWVKRSALVSGTSYTLFSAGSAAQPYTLISFTTGTVSDQLGFDAINAGSVVVGRRYTTQVFRDPSAWYHFVFVWDTTNGTASSRMRIYVNGEVVTTFSLSSDPSSSATTQVNTTNAHYIGSYPAGGNYLNGYLTEIHFIDGQALTPSSFGETDTITGVWKPKRYSGTYGTNGFYLNFKDNSSTSALGTDYSGNSNTWTTNNFSITAGAGNDSLIDTPTPYADGGNGRGNYATLNPLAGNTICVLSNGNLALAATTSDWCRKISTIGVSSGKWYAEFTFSTAGTNTNQVGVVSFVPPVNGLNQNGEETGQSMYNGNNNASLGTIFNDGTRVSTGNTTASSGDVIGVALDASANNVKYYRNGTIVGSSSGYTPTNVSGTWYFVAQCLGSGVIDCNFGQRPFAYTPPSGFVALNTQNLPEPSIKDGTDYFQTVLWSGNSTNGRTITVANNRSVAWQPDLVWTRLRNAANSHYIFDAVRGATKVLFSDGTFAESTNTDTLTAFTSSGFTVDSSINVNGTGYTYVAWCWDESATPGFDIVTYTGTGATTRNISHSLGVAPKFVIVKSRSSGSDNWNCWHTSLNNTAARLLLNTTGAVDTGSPSIWGTGGINPTSTTFQVGDNTGTNGNTYTYVAYLWSEVAGFSKFGSYVGNGSSDGPFVYCGFRPAFVMFKRTDTAGNNWCIQDNKRSAAYNPADAELLPSSSIAESTSFSKIDMLSNGFKVRTTNAGENASGSTYIFAAFAETPQKFSLAR
jgi:hypothetical protein